MASQEMLLKISTRLQLERSKIENLLLECGQKAPDPLQFNQVSLDHFQFISDWHHYAILEAVTLSDFDPSPKWFSNRLGISESKVKEALERLVRLGYLSKNKKGKIEPIVGNNTTTGEAPSAGARREHERQVLELAIEALDRTPVTERNQSSMTLAIPSSRFPEAVEKITRFRREMTALLQRKGERDSVYHLSISFYPISSKTKENK